MSIQTQIGRLTDAKAALKTAIEQKGVAVPEGAPLEQYAPLVEQIEGEGSGTITAPEKIVDFTVDEVAMSYEFTTEQYPKIGKCNAFFVSYKKSQNGSVPWVQIAINGSTVAKITDSTDGFGYARLSVRGGLVDVSSVTKPINTSLAPAQIISGTAVLSIPMRRGVPVYNEDFAVLKKIGINSWQNILDTGSKIEVWGWNE